MHIVNCGNVYEGEQSVIWKNCKEVGDDFEGKRPSELTLKVGKGVS